MVMCPEEVVAEIVIKITPDAVDMIGFVLGIIVFENKVFSLNTIVVRLTTFDTACPSEGNFVETSFFDFRPIFSGDIGATAKEVFFDEFDEDNVLVSGEFGLG